MRAQTTRPRLLHLFRLSYPIGSMASIGHRVSGVVLACALPFAVLLLERSLRSETAFYALLDAVRSPFGRVGLVLIVWASAHHLLAGVRHLLMDVGVGASLSASRRTAYAAIAIAIAIAVAVAGLAAFIEFD